MSSRGCYDVISNLHDTVLCHILSFLPTKQVVATNILSKRWNHLWHSVLHIDLTDDQDVQGTNNAIQLDDINMFFHFHKFVYPVLLKLCSIKSFRLNVGYADIDLKNLSIPIMVKWVDHVVQHGVETLCLTFFYDIDIPVSILSCKTLVTLNLLSFVMKGFSSVRLPCLKVIHLEMCTFRNVRDLALLLSGCPILEDLYLRELEFLSEDPLTYQEFESLSLSKLTKAYMFMVYCNFPLKALHNVEELDMETYLFLEVYPRFDGIPTFHNLTKLKLRYIASQWNFLVQVLNRCPKLQNLELLIYKVSIGGNETHAFKNWVDPKFVPQCLSLHLKTCKFEDFLGQQGELMLARYIMKNARVLQTMIICCREGFKIETELSLWPRASPTCELILDE